MNELDEWLKYQFRISNHKKYLKYYEEWVSNLTQSQLDGFENNRLADFKSVIN
jgi:hypothetical protein